MSQSLSAQAMTERALELSRADECMVLVTEASTANLRWAGNSLTTNGVTRGRSATVISLVKDAAGVRVGSVSQSGLRDDQLEDLVRASEEAARGSAPVKEAYSLVDPASAEASGSEWDAPVPVTDIGVFSEFAPALGKAFERSAQAGVRLYGYAQHTMSATFLGTSTGLRLRHDQRRGRWTSTPSRRSRTIPRGWGRRPAISRMWMWRRWKPSWSGGSRGAAPRWSFLRDGMRRCCLRRRSLI